MKKILTVILCSVLCLSILPIAAAEVDLSNMSFDELLELQAQVNLAIFNSDKWKEVEVPMGVWDIGKDIPAGRYELSPGANASTYTYPYVVYYLDRSEKSGTPDKIRGQYRIKVGETLVIELFEGNVLKIEDTSVIFKRYVPSFNFE